MHPMPELNVLDLNACGVYCTPYRVVRVSPHRLCVI
jgi:hypothetical protein